MKNLLMHLWRRDEGSTHALQVILFSSIVALGAIVGLTTVRDQIVQQFGDLAVSLETLDQSYTAGAFGGYSATAVEPTPPIDGIFQPPANLDFVPPVAGG